VLLAAALAANALGVVPHTEVGSVLFWAATESNIWLIGFNLLPMAPLDGATAWAFPYLLGKVARHRLTAQSAGRSEPVVEADDPLVSAKARAMVDSLLEDARRKEDEP
jgi:Zn-dependent protease